MTQKPKLEPGQRIRFVGWARVTGFEEVNYFAEFPTQATVDMLVTNSPDSVRIKYGTDLQGLIHRRQVTHVLRPKQKPEKERVGLECWTDRKEFHRISPLDSGFPLVSRAQLIGDQYAHLVELSPGEIVLGREELARAWDSSHLVEPSRRSDAFKQVCSFLGLGET